MSLPAQAKLLRVLQEGVIEPLGTSTPVTSTCASSRRPTATCKERVAEGRFREDLYYRLNVLDLKVPPLRERRRRPAAPGRALPPALHARRPRAAGELTPRAWRRSSSYPFPGNVRELAHAIERAVVLARGGEIDLEHLPSDIAGPGLHPSRGEASLRPLAVAIKEFESDYLKQALQLCDGKRARAAELLGISRKNLWEKLRAYGIETPDEVTEPIELVDRSASRDDD